MLEKLIQNLRDQGHIVELRGDTLIIDGVPTPIVQDESQPYRSDCPGGKCDI
jgi:hypothetical protein